MKNIFGSIAAINLYAHFVFLNLFGLLVIYWEEGGRFLNCFGFNRRLDDGLCKDLDSEVFYVKVLIIALWSTILSLFIYLSKNPGIKIVLYKVVKNISILLLLIFVIGFIPLEFCFIFGGCSDIYLWPLTLPLLIIYFITAFVYARFVHKKLNNFQQKSFWSVFVINFFLALFAVFYIIGGTHLGGYMADRDLLKYSHTPKESFIEETESGIVEIIFDPKTKKTQSRHNHIFLNKQYLVAEDKYVKVALLDNDRNIVKPRYLRIASETPIVRYSSNSSDYFIEDGVIYAGSHHIYPFEYFLEGVNEGLTTVKILANNGIVSMIEHIPVLKGTKMFIEFSITEGRRHIDKIKYDLEGDGMIDTEISWIEEYDRLSHIKQVLVFLVNDSGLNNQDKLKVIKFFEDGSYGEVLKLLELNRQDDNLSSAREIIAGLILLEY